MEELDIVFSIKRQSKNYYYLLTKTGILFENVNKKESTRIINNFQLKQIYFSKNFNKNGTTRYCFLIKRHNKDYYFLHTEKGTF